MRPNSMFPLAFAGIVASQSSLAGNPAVDDAARSPWYIGLGLGLAPIAQFEMAGTSNDFEDITGNGFNGVLRVSIGKELREEHTLAVELGVVFSAGSDGPLDYIATLSHEMLTYAYRPASRDYFLRAGVGLGHMSREEDTELGSLDGSSDGAAILVGAGYTFWTSGRLDIAVNIDYEIHQYSSTSGDFDDIDSASATQLCVTFNWH